MGEQTIYLAGGCFWGLEKYLAAIPGVRGTRAGYANGRVVDPSYEQVCTGETDAVETVEVRWEDSALGLGELLALFFEVIDPTSVNRQGNDIGRQYRTGIYWSDPADEPVVRGALAELAAVYPGRGLVVEALPLDTFYEAEEYHQHYLDKNPGGYCHIRAGAIASAPARLEALRAAAV